MGLRRTRSAPTWWLLPLAACAASSLPREVQIEPGRRTLVSLADLRSGHTLVLQNLSSGSRGDIYGDDGSSDLVKVVPDESLQQLLDVLAAQGMFAQATSTPAPGARAVLTVELPERRYVWSRPTPSAATLEQIQAFEAGRGYVLAVYNSETAYHRGSVQDLYHEGSEVFRPVDRANIEQVKAAAKAKLEAQQQGDGDQGPRR
ncbi:MAG: hypothetical protein AB7O97_19015 [Planctomycetota bacterium]